MTSGAHRDRLEVTQHGEHSALRPRSETSFRREFIETGFAGVRRGRFLAADAEDRMLGTIIFFTVDTPNRIEIGYHPFARDSRNKGILTEALPLAVRQLFASRKIDRFQIANVAVNGASRRLALKCGFRLERARRRNARSLGHESDVLLYSLLRDEAEPR